MHALQQADVTAVIKCLSCQTFCNLEDNAIQNDLEKKEEGLKNNAHQT